MIRQNKFAGLSRESSYNYLLPPIERCPISQVSELPELISTASVCRNRLSVMLLLVFE